jgi:hypothetical protein
VRARHEDRSITTGTAPGPINEEPAPICANPALGSGGIAEPFVSAAIVAFIRFATLEQEAYVRLFLVDTSV